MRTVTTASLLALVLVAGCEGTSTPPSMPDVKGLRLDAAKSEIKRAGFSEDVSVVGGGALGILREKNWTVCEQEPLRGKPLTGPPRLVVARECSPPASHQPTIAATSPIQPPSPTAAKTHAAASSSPGTPGTCEPTPGDSHCHFGQKAIYRDTIRTGERLLEITVGTPTHFKPGARAVFMPQLPRRVVNVYFPVTIRNLSPSLNVASSDILAEVRTSTQFSGLGGEILSVTDEAQGIGSLGESGEIGPGHSHSTKDGYSMVTLDAVQYELRIDGLAGYSITFER